MMEIVAINVPNRVGYADLSIPRPLNQFQTSCHATKADRSTLYIYRVSVCGNLHTV